MKKLTKEKIENILYTITFVTTYAGLFVYMFIK